MNTYEITFQRENGTTGSDRFTAATEAQARRDFREVYRHGNGQIIKAELISTGTLATKEQERKALEKIKKIVEELGKGSYIGTAFAGCFEIAESNIENDFADSMKERYEQAKEDADHFKSASDTLSKEVDSLREENRTLKEKSLTPQERAEYEQKRRRDLEETAAKLGISPGRLEEIHKAARQPNDTRRMNRAQAHAILRAALDKLGKGFLDSLKTENYREALDTVQDIDGMSDEDFSTLLARRMDILDDEERQEAQRVISKMIECWNYDGEEPLSLREEILLTVQSMVRAHNYRAET